MSCQCFELTSFRLNKAGVSSVEVNGFFLKVPWQQSWPNSKNQPPPPPPPKISLATRIFPLQKDVVPVEKKMKNIEKRELLQPTKQPICSYIIPLKKNKQQHSPGFSFLFFLFSTKKKVVKKIRPVFPVSRQGSAHQNSFSDARLDAFVSTHLPGGELDLTGQPVGLLDKNPLRNL